MKRSSFLPNKSKKAEQHLFNEGKNKQVHLQINIYLKNIAKIEKYKKSEVQSINE